MTGALLTFLGLPMVCAGALVGIRADDLLGALMTRCAVVAGVGLILTGACA